MNVRLEIQLANKPGALVRVLGLAARIPNTRHVN